MAPHDHSYKLLFSHPRMVRDLLVGFVRGEWLAQVDFDSLEKVNGAYVTDDLRARASDLVWRVRWRKDWVYLLLEFQSSVEQRMSVRTLTYIGLLYQDLIRSRRVRANHPLPPILPIVLYNGSARWNAPRELGATVRRGPQALKRYCPKSRYLLIEERKCRDTELTRTPPHNLAGALFRLENSESGAEIEDVAASLVEQLKTPDHADLRHAFSTWINSVMMARYPGGSLDKVVDLKEMCSMFAGRVDELKAKFRREGEREGVRKGEAKYLLGLLKIRFGEVPGWVARRVREAQPAQLERWGERLFDARNLDEFFDGKGRAAHSS